MTKRWKCKGGSIMEVYNIESRESNISGHKQQSKQKLYVISPQVKCRQAAVFSFQTKRRPQSPLRQKKSCLCFWHKMWWHRDTSEVWNNSCRGLRLRVTAWTAYDRNIQRCVTTELSYDHELGVTIKNTINVKTCFSKKTLKWLFFSH